MRMTNPLEVMNHLLLGSLLLMFVIQHSAISPSPLKYGSTIVAQAQQYQPGTPPPMLDPEQFDSMFEEADVKPYAFEVR